MALAAPFSASTSAIFSSPEKNDFTLSDIYAQIANDRAVRKLDDRIVILDIGHGGREEIAEMLEILTLCGPTGNRKLSNVQSPFLKPDTFLYVSGFFISIPIHFLRKFCRLKVLYYFCSKIISK